MPQSPAVCRQCGEVAPWGWLGSSHCREDGVLKAESWPLTRAVVNEYAEAYAASLRAEQQGEHA